VTWMLIRLVLSLAFVGAVLWFAARIAKKRGLGGGGNHGLIEVVARQRMGRSSTVNVVRIGDVVLVVGATEEQVTLLAEVDGEAVETALREREEARLARLAARPGAGQPPAALGGTEDGAAPHRPLVGARTSTGALSGSVFDRAGWGSFVNQLRERTVRHR
jgi:flagellar protein FliO/FliZ